MKHDILERLVEARAARKPVALATVLDGGAQWLITADEAPADAPRAVIEAARTALSDDDNRTVEAGGQRVFIQVHNPPWRMLIVGAVHIAQPLARIAALADYDVTVIDPRGAFATPERFLDIAVSDEWPDDALDRLRPDARSAVVTLTHDPKLDDPALAVALRSDAFYIGALGSTRTHAKRIERLKETGFDDAAIARIHGPIGLAIGARAPAEIAVAILAQVIEARRRGRAKARAAA